MMGWAIILGFAALTGLGLWRFGLFSGQSLQFALAGLLLGGAGYALQGSPGMVGSPKAAPDDQSSEQVPEKLRTSFRSSMSSEGQWLMLSEALLQSGHNRAAVSILGEGVRRAPQNADVWVGMGQALFIHGGNQMNPAASFAFDKAEQLAPDVPGPAFFRGLGLAQAGRLDEAAAVWEALLAKAPKDAEWRADLEQRLAEMKRMR
jgi:cytochrome c-type biogenesis protein CcmH